MNRRGFFTAIAGLIAGRKLLEAEPAKQPYTVTIETGPSYRSGSAILAEQRLRLRDALMFMPPPGYKFHPAVYTPEWRTIPINFPDRPAMPMRDAHFS